MAAWTDKKLVLGLFVAFVVAGAMLKPAAATAVSAAQEVNTLPCDCTDVDPRITFIEPANYTCWEQYKFGQCGMDFMKKTILEIPEGYCEITCGKCQCCPSLLNATLAAGLTEFAWAMNLSSQANRTEDLSQPGLMVTLLAPDNNAMLDLFKRLGGKELIMSDKGIRDKLGAIMDLHVLPDLPDSRAVWTTPFFLNGTRLASVGVQPGAEILETARSDNGDIEIRSPGSSAKITQRDIYACKGFVNVLDWYLLPNSNEFA